MSEYDHHARRSAAHARGVSPARVPAAAGRAGVEHPAHRLRAEPRGRAALSRGAPGAPAVRRGAVARRHRPGARGRGRARTTARRPVLELGAGTGLPGIVAASLGARVVQTDRQEVAMSVCRRNGERNGVADIEHRLVDWAEWADDAALRLDHRLRHPVRRVDAPAPAPHLRDELAPGGRILLSDPFRATSLRCWRRWRRRGGAIG